MTWKEYFIIYVCALVLAFVLGQIFVAPQVKEQMLEDMKTMNYTMTCHNGDIEVFNYQTEIVCGGKNPLHPQVDPKLEFNFTIPLT